MSVSDSQKPKSGKEILRLMKREGVPEIILYMHEHKKARYSELKKVLKSEATLVRALKILTEEDILSRKLLDEKYRPTEYAITEKGERIGKSLKELIDLDI